MSHTFVPGTSWGYSCASWDLSWTCLDVLKFIVKYEFCDTIPILFLSLRLFLTLCVSNATSERSFSKLKLIKNYLRSVMSQERLTSLALISIEIEMAKSIDFDEIINIFALRQPRKVVLV